MKKILSFLAKKEIKPNANLVFGINKRRIPTWQQFKYLPQLWSKKEKTLAQICLALCLGGLIFILGAFYFLNTTAKPVSGGEYIEGLVGTPEYINPILAQANDVDLDLSRLIFSSLFVYNSQQELVPDLCTNYTLSEDQKTYTFFLRSDITWHDGEKLSADDVIFTIQAIQDKAYKSPLRSSLSGIAVKKLDDYSFSLVLNEPYAPFISSLTFGILPQHRWYDLPPQNINLSEDNLKPIGSGMYKFTSLVKNKDGTLKSYQLIRNENYYGIKPYIEKLNFVFYADTFSAVEAAQNGKIDGLSFVPTESKQSLIDKNKDLKYYSLRLPQYTAIFFNQKHSDILAKDEVRQALIYGVDRERIIQDVLQGDGEVIYTPILPGYVGYNPEVEKYAFDIERGKQILEEAGWKMPEGETYRYKDDKLLEFTISTVEQTEYLQTLDILRENWAAMGIKVNINTYSVEDIQNQVIKPRAYEALLFGEIVGNDPDPYPFWHSSQMTSPGLALAIFYQKDVDNLIETARKTTDPEQRRLKYLNFQNILASELPAIFLFNPKYIYAVNKKIQGINSQYISMPSDRFAGIENWYIKTKRFWN